MNHAGSDNLQLLKLSKAQIKSLQEAMYHSTENNHLDITLDLRNLGIPWTLHCWMHTLATAHDQQLENIIDQLLQDFLQVWPDDYSTQFVDECLPLLFNIFRFSKNEGTTLLLADIFSTCFGWESIKSIKDTSFSGGTRIDPKFVNNPELSDVQFRVEGRVFYGHKIVLVTWSPKFRAMLSSKVCDGNPPIVHINDIRYHIFQLVMQYLYNGGCETLQVEQSDVLELMAAANFFQLNGLLRYCEAQCSSMVDLDNIVSMYIHAKVYNAGELLEYCQGFLLQNMVALLTYDDSVKRLLFGKKLHSHDVLSGLLLTLQARIKARNVVPTIRPNTKTK
jgi:ankyrin repeat/BTB/POZ domain-containing protein 2